MTNSKKKEIPKLRLRIKLNIGEDAIGPGKAKLLDAVDQH